MRVWGERQIPPSQIIAAERGERRLWDEAMQALGWPLRVKGIVA
jgi:hypothetical protein